MSPATPGGEGAAGPQPAISRDKASSSTTTDSAWGPGGVMARKKEKLEALMKFLGMVEVSKENRRVKEVYAAPGFPATKTAQALKTSAQMAKDGKVILNNNSTSLELDIQDNRAYSDERKKAVLADVRTALSPESPICFRLDKSLVDTDFAEFEPRLQTVYVYGINKSNNRCTYKIRAEFTSQEYRDVAYQAAKKVGGSRVATTYREPTQLVSNVVELRWYFSSSESVNAQDIKNALEQAVGDLAGRGFVARLLQVVEVFSVDTGSGNVYRTGSHSAFLQFDDDFLFRNNGEGLKQILPTRLQLPSRGLTETALRSDYEHQAPCNTCHFIGHTASCEHNNNSNNDETSQGRATGQTDESTPVPHSPPRIPLRLKGKGTENTHGLARPSHPFPQTVETPTTTIQRTEPSIEEDVPPEGSRSTPEDGRTNSEDDETATIVESDSDDDSTATIKGHEVHDDSEGSKTGGEPVEEQEERSRSASSEDGDDRSSREATESSVTSSDYRDEAKRDAQLWQDEQDEWMRQVEEEKKRSRSDSDEEDRSQGDETPTTVDGSGSSPSNANDDALLQSQSQAGELPRPLPPRTPDRAKKLKRMSTGASLSTTPRRSSARVKAALLRGAASVPEISTQSPTAPASAGLWSDNTDDGPGPLPLFAEPKEVAHARSAAAGANSSTSK